MPKSHGSLRNRLRRAEREFVAKEKQTFIVAMRGDKSMIVAIERDSPGDPI
ncbi:MAG: hypothetical protein NNA18_07355 [Nitrospira sp.]|nr:hypothetical protein [Nitrospira sp.]